MDMSEKELEQLQHFIHLMQECHAEVAKVKDSKDAKLVEEAETNLAEAEAAMLQYMYNILYEAGMIPVADDGSKNRELPF